MCSITLRVMRTWERHDSDLTRPVAAPLDRCAELLGVDLATVRKAAANVEPYIVPTASRGGVSCSLSVSSAPRRTVPARPVATSPAGAPSLLARCWSPSELPGATG
jgi:hypothetical protein